MVPLGVQGGAARARGEALLEVKRYFAARDFVVSMTSSMMP